MSDEYPDLLTAREAMVWELFEKEGRELEDVADRMNMETDDVAWTIATVRGKMMDSYKLLKWADEDWLQP